MTLFEASTWVIPVIIAVTFHEAIHGFVARMCGDDTAWRLGRVSFNPLKHIDPFGTILLPGMLLMLLSPFLFGYPPVPVNFGPAIRGAYGPGRRRRARHEPRARRPGGSPSPRGLPTGRDQSPVARLGNALPINVVLAVNNMLPLPLDGGRVAVGLPDVLARRWPLEPFGMLILLGVLFLSRPGRATGVDLSRSRAVGLGPAPSLAPSCA